MIVHSIVALSARIAPFGRFRRLGFGLGSWVVSPDFWAFPPAPVGLVLSLSVFLCIRFFVLLAM